MRTIATLVLLSIFSQVACGQNRTDDQNWIVLRYIDRYKDIAMEEMIRAGVPASIKLGQAVLESNSGRSDLSRKANNHFGLKCGSTWEGGTYAHEDDDYDENGNLIKSCFRKFDNAKRSFYGHSEFLQKPRYRHLFSELDVQDYKSWAHGLKTAGYATNPKYATILIGIIERYELFKYDKMALEESTIEGIEDPILASTSGTISRNNDLRMVYAGSDQTASDIASQYKVKLKCILNYNEKLGSGAKKLKQGEKIYLQKKRKNWRGREKYHFVKEGETMYQIAQLYGIRLSRLYKKNRMDIHTQPEEGAKLKIRGRKIKADQKPQLRSSIFNEDGDNGSVEDQPKTNTKDDEFLFDDDQVEIYHSVVKGDTLYSLALRYDITVDTLKKMNNLTSNRLSVGQRLRVK